MSLETDAKDTAKKKAALNEAAKSFQFHSVLARFKRYSPPVRVHANGELKAQIDVLAKQIAAAEKSGGEASLTEDSADELIAEHDRLVDEYEADVVEFKFRPSVSTDWDLAREQLAADRPDVDQAKPGSMEHAYPYIWAQTCESPEGMTAEDFRALKALIGDAAAAELHEGWLTVNNGGSLEDVDAPFSRSHWPTRTKDQ